MSMHGFVTDAYDIMVALPILTDLFRLCYQDIMIARLSPSMCLMRSTVRLGRQLVVVRSYSSRVGTDQSIRRARQI